MNESVTHVIEIDSESDQDRSYWQCDCGRSGSADPFVVDMAAEKHINPGEPVIYRHSGK